MYRSLYFYREIFYSALGLSIGLTICLQCCSGLRRRVPYNYILLGVFTLAEGYLLGSVSATYSVQEVAIAVALTIVIVTALTVFALQVGRIVVFICKRD